MPPNTASAPTIRVGIPDGVDPEKVRSRKVAMMAAGTPEIIADSLAITAAHQQHLRDTKTKEKIVVKEKVVKEAVAEIETEKNPNLSKSNPPKKVPTPAPAKAAAVKKNGRSVAAPGKPAGAAADPAAPAV